MIISFKYKFIFIKTYKTAGSSIESYLYQFLSANDVYAHTADRSGYNVYFSHADANFSTLGGALTEGDLAGAPDSNGVLGD